jgi:hypothetical protein
MARLKHISFKRKVIVMRGKNCGPAGWQGKFDNYDEGGEQVGWGGNPWGNWDHSPKGGFGRRGMGGPGFRGMPFWFGFWQQRGPWQGAPGPDFGGHAPHGHHPGHRHEHGHRHGNEQWRERGRDWFSNENIDFMIQRLENMQAWLAKRQEQLKQAIDELRAEKARRSESRAEQRSGSATPTGDVDGTML